MKVLLSGTSNSILAKGISHGIATHPAVTHFENVSLGASGIIAVGDHMRRIDFSKHDICILDYHVNEEVLIQMGLTHVEDSISNLAAICDAASRAGCLPIVVIFPLANRFYTERPFETKLFEGLAQFGLPVFNFYPIIARLASEMIRPVDDFFLDPNHINRVIACIFGQSLIDTISEWELSLAHVVETTINYRSLNFISYTELSVRGVSSVERRSSSLITADLLHIEPDAQLSLPKINCGWELAGMTFNAARSWGAMRDETSNIKVLEAKNQILFTLERNLTLVALPFLHTARLTAEITNLIYVSSSFTGAERPPMGFEIFGLILQEQQPACALKLLIPSATSNTYMISEVRYSEMRKAMSDRFLANSNQS